MRKILIVMGRYLPGYKDGGPVQSIKNLVDRLGREYEFHIVTVDRDHGDSSSYKNIKYDTWNQVGNAKVWYVKPAGFSEEIIVRLSNECDILYMCGCFNDYARVIMRLKKKNSIKVPVVIASMGLFSSGAFRINYAKKKLYITMGKVLGWFQKVSWSVTSEEEQKDVKRIIGNKANCYVAKDIPRLVEEAPESITKEAGELRVVFLSRLSPKKNLDYAIDVVGEIKGNIFFDIYGMLEDKDYYQLCKEKISQLPPNIRCNYQGEISPDKVIETFSKYHVFLFPTKGENYGHVIYEALAGGCIPVISDQTPWQELADKQIGYVIPLSQKEEFVQVLQRVTDMDAVECQRMQKQAAAYALVYQQKVDCDGYRRIFALVK